MNIALWFTQKVHVVLGSLSFGITGLESNRQPDLFSGFCFGR